MVWGDSMKNICLKFPFKEIPSEFLNLRGIDTIFWYDTEIKNKLKAEYIYYILQLVQLNESDLFKIRGLGKKSVSYIAEKLRSHGLSLGMTIEHPFNQDMIRRLKEIENGF